jgi:hypothetical protein
MRKGTWPKIEPAEQVKRAAEAVLAVMPHPFGRGDSRRRPRRPRSAPAASQRHLGAARPDHSDSRSRRLAVAVKGQQPRTVVGVEADKFELERWGRAAALSRQELPTWIKRTLNETAQQDEQRRCPLPLKTD